MMRNLYSSLSYISAADNRLLTSLRQRYSLNVKQCRLISLRLLHLHNQGRWNILRWGLVYTKIGQPRNRDFLFIVCNKHPLSS